MLQLVLLLSLAIRIMACFVDLIKHLQELGGVALLKKKPESKLTSLPAELTSLVVARHKQLFTEAGGVIVRHDGDRESDRSTTRSYL